MDADGVSEDQARVALAEGPLAAAGVLEGREGAERDGLEVLAPGRVGGAGGGGTGGST